MVPVTSASEPFYPRVTSKSSTLKDSGPHYSSRSLCSLKLILYPDRNRNRTARGHPARQDCRKSCPWRKPSDLTGRQQLACKESNGSPLIAIAECSATPRRTLKELYSLPRSQQNPSAELVIPRHMSPIRNQQLCRCHPERASVSRYPAPRM